MSDAVLAIVSVRDDGPVMGYFERFHDEEAAFKEAEEITEAAGVDRSDVRQALDEAGAFELGEGTV